MKKQLAIWQLIIDCLQAEVPVMLPYVLNSIGSSPGRQGFFMAVTANRPLAGSIGGGIMENKIVGLAKENLKQENQECLVRKQIHDKAAAKHQSGMICSGEQTILMYRIRKKDDNCIRQLLECGTSGKNGKLEFSPAGMRFFNASPEIDFSFYFNSDADWQYTEKTGYKNHLHIVGAGHCSLAFSKIMSTMDFFIHLYDDRKELPTYAINEFVQKKQLLNDYYELEHL